MNLTELKNYILADAELAALAGTPGVNGDYPNSKDQTICEVANARNVPASKKVPVENAFLYLIKTGKWRALKAAANDPANPATDAAFSAVELMGAPALKVDFLDPVSNSLIDVLVTAGLLSAADKTAIQAMCATQVSDAEIRFGQKLNNLDVAKCFGRVGFGS